MFRLCCRGLDVTPITLALSGAAAYPRACQALSSMLSRNALNPADVTVVSPACQNKYVVVCIITWQLFNVLCQILCHVNWLLSVLGILSPMLSLVV